MRPMLQEDEEGPLQDPRQDEHQDHLLRREEQCRDVVRAVRRREVVQEARLRGRPGDQGDARQRQGTEGGVQRQGRRRRREAEGTQGRRQGRQGRREGGEAQGRRRQGGQEGRPEGGQGEAQGRRGSKAGEEGQVRPRAAGLGREARQGHAAVAARHEHGRPRPAPREDEAGQAAGRRRRRAPGAARRAPGPADDGAARGGAGGGRAVHLAGAGRAHVLQLRPDALRPAVVLRRRLRRRVRRGVPVLQAAGAGRRVLRRAGARPPGVVPWQPAAVLPAAAAATVLRRGPQRRVQRHVIDWRRAMDRDRAIRHQASVISHQCVCGHSHSLTHGLWLKFSFSFLSFVPWPSCLIRR